jgi:hypothetical protein
MNPVPDLPPLGDGLLDGGPEDDRGAHPGSGSPTPG